MDILAYEYLKQGLKEYNDKCGKIFGNVVVSYPTSKPPYPYTVFDEIRNVATNFNSNFDRVASTGYVVRVYAKTKGNIDKQFIARTVAQMIDEYLSSFKLTRISFNANESLNDNSIYEIIITYSGNLHENRRNFI